MHCKMIRCCLPSRARQPGKRWVQEVSGEMFFHSSREGPGGIISIQIKAATRSTGYTLTLKEFGLERRRRYLILRNKSARGAFEQGCWEKVFD